MRGKAPELIHISTMESMAPITSIITMLTISIATIKVTEIRIVKTVIVVPAILLNYNNRIDLLPGALMYQNKQYFFLHTTYS